MPRKPLFKRRAEEWIEKCADRMLSEKTLRVYEQCLRYAWRFGSANGWPNDPRQIRPRHLREYYDSMQGLSTATQKMRLEDTLLPFLRWTGNTNLDAVEFRISVCRTRVDWLSVEQVGLLLRSAPNATCRAVVALQAMTGMRVGELCSLRLKDLHDSYVQVRGKGRKSRSIPIDARLWKHLVPYLALRERWPSSELLLVHPWKGRIQGYSENSVTDIIRRNAQRHGLHASSHTLRRTFGRSMFKNGCPLPELRQIMGHSTVEQTIAYLGIGDADIQEAVSLYLPDFDRKVYLEAKSQPVRQG